MSLAGIEVDERKAKQNKIGKLSRGQNLTTTLSNFVYYLQEMGRQEIFAWMNSVFTAELHSCFIQEYYNVR